MKYEFLSNYLFFQLFFPFLILETEYCTHRVKECRDFIYTSLVFSCTVVFTHVVSEIDVFDQQVPVWQYCVVFVILNFCPFCRISPRNLRGWVALSATEQLYRGTLEFYSNRRPKVDTCWLTYKRNHVSFLKIFHDVINTFPNHNYVIKAMQWQ